MSATQPLATTLTPELLGRMDAYWRAANYLSVGQIYLYDNPLLKRPLTLADVKHMLLGHWGTTPGQNFIYVHFNRVIKKYDLDMIYVSGPGHGGPAVVANTYLEGTYSEVYPNISQDEAGLQKLFLQFSFPGGIPSHASPECPGSIHEGGELGYSLSHAFGAVFDNPDLVVACVVGDGEAETGPLATGVAFEQVSRSGDRRRGPADPAPQRLQDCQPDASSPASPARNWSSCSAATGGRPISSRVTNPSRCTRPWPRRSTRSWSEIRNIQQDARNPRQPTRPRWPMIVLNSPKGWTGPKVVDGRQVEGTFRSHQVPLSDPASPSRTPRAVWKSWLKSYRPEELFDEQGRLKPELAELAPKGERRMGANPHANGGMLLRDLRMPDFRDYAVDVPSPGVRGIGDTHVLGRFLRDVVKLNAEQRNFRVFGPDETLSNGLEALFEVTNRQWDAGDRAERRIPRAHRAGDGDAQRASMRGLARGLPAHRAAWTLQLLRGVHPHRRFDVQPARQVAEGHVAPAVAAEDRLVELPAGLARLASGSQRLHPPGSRLHRSRREQEGRDRPRVSAAGCQLPAVGDGPLPAQPPLRQRRRSRANTRRRSG